MGLSAPKVLTCTVFWSSYVHKHAFRSLGQLIVYDAGYPFWVGKWTVALCQFRDNILLASDAPQDEWGEVVELVRGVLQKAWGLLVVCECIGLDVSQWQGECRGQVCKAMGMVSVKDESGEGMSFTEPAALTAQW